MRDVETLLRKSLSARADTYSPADVDAAERRFLERRGRRRLIRAGGGAVLAAAAVVAVFALARPEVVTTPEPQLEPAGLAIAERFQVADEPLAIAGGPGGLWVASRAGNSVSHIDPATGETERVRLEGAVDIAAGEANAWAGSSEGRMLRIDAQTIEVTGEYVSDAGAAVEDMAVGGHEQGAAWALDSSGCLVDLTNPGPGDGCVNPPYFQGTDVATAPNETWLLDGDTGTLHQVHAGPGVNDGRSALDPDAPAPTAPRGRYADLLITTDGNDALWVSGEGGQLMKLDLVTGQKAFTQLDGDYADLAAGYYSVWALVGHEGSERGELVAIDVETGAPVGEPLALSGKPSDVVATADGVWVTLRNADEVVRVSDPAR